MCDVTAVSLDKNWVKLRQRMCSIEMHVDRSEFTALAMQGERTGGVANPDLLNYETFSLIMERDSLTA